MMSFKLIVIRFPLKYAWPDSLEGILAFSKGRYKETVEMGGGMYAITFLDVTEADLETYRGTLSAAGFQKQDQQDTEGYMKMDGKMAYSIRLVLEGVTLQVIAIGQNY